MLMNANAALDRAVKFWQDQRDAAPEQLAKAELDVAKAELVVAKAELAVAEAKLAVATDESGRHNQLLACASACQAIAAALRAAPLAGSREEEAADYIARANHYRQRSSPPGASVRLRPLFSDAALDISFLPSAAGQKFLDALLNAQLEQVDEPTGMMKLDLGIERDSMPYNISPAIAVRAVARVYWDNIASSARNIVAIGSPGVGKSTTIPYLIKKLVEAGKNVMLQVRVNEKFSRYFYYHKVNGAWRCDVPNTTDPDAIMYLPQLKDPDTVLVVEAHTVRTQFPAIMIKCRFVLVCSPRDEYHKDIKGDSHGSANRLFYPLWSLEELQAARMIIPTTVEPAAAAPAAAGAASDAVSAGDPMEPLPSITLASEVHLTAEQIMERYDIFGGVPRLVFLNVSQELRDAMVSQRRAVKKLSYDELRDLLSYESVSSLDGANQYSSKIVGFVRTDDTFRSRVELISPHVKRLLFVRHLPVLWSTFSSMTIPAEAGYGFERYCLSLIREGARMEYRVLCGMGAIARSGLSVVEFGAATRDDMGDPVAAAKQQPANGSPRRLIVPTSSQHPDYDALLCEGDGRFALFQCTVGETHRANAGRIQSIADQLGCTAQCPLAFYFAVPSSRASRFVTDPVHLNVGENVALRVLIVQRPLTSTI
jgi:hypothetical protein